MAGSDSRLSVADALALFMDTAALAASWGDWMDRGVFFITVKTRFQFLGSPHCSKRWRSLRAWNLRMASAALRAIPSAAAAKCWLGAGPNGR